MKSLVIAIFFSMLMVLKWIMAKFIYPISYLLRDWVYGRDKIQNYTIPTGVQSNYIKWFFWLFLDDDQPKGYPDWYAISLIGYLPITYWDKFRCAYSWSAWRNPAYNINYNYFSNQSRIIEHKVVFGTYSWNRKLRASNGDNGTQLVMYKTEKGQSRFLFSLAYVSIPITIYYGWNTDYNGRFTVAFKFK